MINKQEESHEEPVALGGKGKENQYFNIFSVSIMHPTIMLPLIIPTTNNMYYISTLKMKMELSEVKLFVQLTSGKITAHFSLELLDSKVLPASAS